MGIALAHPDVVKDSDQEKPYIRFTKFNDSSMDFRLAVWVNDVRKMWKVSSDLREQIDLKFKEANIEIPFPQSVITVRNNDEKLS